MSYFAPGYDVSIADLMPIADEVNQTGRNEAKRLSHLSVISRIEGEERRERRRASRRMSAGVGAEVWRTGSREYAML